MERETEMEIQRDKEKRGRFSKMIGYSNSYLLNLHCVTESEERYTTLTSCFISLLFCFALLFFSSVNQNYIVLFLRKSETRCGDRQASLPEW